MCKRCEGQSIEAVYTDLADTVERHGFAIQQVDDASSGWSYSIGLWDRFRHPDLFCIDAEPKTQAQLINRIGRAVVSRAPVGAVAFELDVTLVAVHDRHLDDGWFSSWEGIEGRAPQSGEILQIVPGASWFCSCHESSVRVFDRPVPRPPARRARRRSRPSSRHLQLPAPRPARRWDANDETPGGS